jgi:hypothetical protein
MWGFKYNFRRVLQKSGQVVTLYSIQVIKYMNKVSVGRPERKRNLYGPRIGARIILK